MIPSRLAGVAILVAAMSGCDGSSVSGSAKVVGVAVATPAASDNEPPPPPTAGPPCVEVAAAMTASSSAGPSDVSVKTSGGEKVSVKVDTGAMVRQSIERLCREKAWSATAKRCLVERTSGNAVDDLRALRDECGLRSSEGSHE